MGLDLWCAICFGRRLRVIVFDLRLESADELRGDRESAAHRRGDYVRRASSSSAFSHLPSRATLPSCAASGCYS